MSNKELLEHLREALRRYETGHEDCKKWGICYTLFKITASIDWYGDDRFYKLIKSCHVGKWHTGAHIYPVGKIPPRIDLLKKVIKKVEEENIEL